MTEKYLSISNGVGNEEPDLLVIQANSTLFSASDDLIVKTRGEVTHFLGIFSEITKRESGAKNRLFKNPLWIGRSDPIAMKTYSESAYRVTGYLQVQDIIESGYVRPPIGKAKGGHAGEVFWSEWGDDLFFYDKRPVLEIDKYRVNETVGVVKITDLKAIWIFNPDSNCYEDRLADFFSKTD